MENQLCCESVSWMGVPGSATSSESKLSLESDDSESDYALDGGSSKVFSIRWKGFRMYGFSSS